MKTTIKEVFESDNWQITRIIQGFDKQVRIDASKKYSNEKISKWCSLSYANMLCRKNKGKNIEYYH